MTVTEANAVNIGRRRGHEKTAPVPPCLQAWCPTCQQAAMPDDRGRCVWCDTTITPHRPLAPARVAAPPRGVFPMLTDELLEQARRMYFEELQSLRAVARALHPASGYASANTMLMGLLTQFDANGWPRRDRIAETVRVTTKHGLSRRGCKDPTHRHNLGVASGAIRDVACKGHRTSYPRKGAPCQRMALRDGEYCAAHEPARAAARVEHLERARARIGHHEPETTL